MHKILSLTSSGIAIALLSASNVAFGQSVPWPMAGGNPHHTGRVDTVFPKEAAQKFHTSVGKYGFGGSVVGSDASGNDVIYGASHDSTFGEAAWAVAADGTLLWTSPIPDGSSVDVTPWLDASNGILYFASQDNSVHAIDAGTGAVLWSEGYDPDPSTFFRSSPTPGPSGAMYLVTDPPLLGGSSALFAIDADGTLSWTESFGPYSHGDGAVAVLDDGSIIAVTGCLNNDGDPAGRVVKLDAQGNEIWSYCHDAPFPFWGTPAVDADGSIYFGANSQVGTFLMALNGDGSVKWETLSIGSKGSPAIGPQWVYFIDMNDELVAIDKSTGARQWGIPVGAGMDQNRAAPVVDACGNVAAASTGGKMVAATPSGTLLWEVDFEGQALSGPSVGSDGTLFVRGYGLFAFGGDESADCDPIVLDGGVPDGGVPEAGAADASESDGAVDAADDAAEAAADALPSADAEADGAVAEDAQAPKPDAGVDAAAPTDAGGAGSSNSSDESESDGGCGCRTARAGGPDAGIPFALFAVLLGWRRRRRLVTKRALPPG